MVGEVIEHYQILQRLGEGGMGTVYRALDTQLEREVALKVLRADLSDQPDVTKRFRAEAVALARLSHPHIATLFGLARRDDQLCMVMELVRGDTLASLMKRERAFDVERAVRLTMQILAALEYTHESGIVHRDVKPSNVIVSPSGVAKVLDFGIARVLDSDRLTQQGLIVGTPRYMAPEQIRGAEVDGRADVYATAVLLYEMIAGRLPFGDAKGIEMIYAHLEGVATPLTDVAPHTPPWLWTMIQRAMARSRDERLAASKFRALLDQGLSGAGVPDRSTGPTFAMPAPAADARRHESGSRRGQTTVLQDGGTVPAPPPEPPPGPISGATAVPVSGPISVTARAPVGDGDYEAPTRRNTPSIPAPVLMPPRTPVPAPVPEPEPLLTPVPTPTPGLQYQTAPIEASEIELGRPRTAAPSRAPLIAAGLAGLILVLALALWLLPLGGGPEPTEPTAVATAPPAATPAPASPPGGPPAGARSGIRPARPAAGPPPTGGSPATPAEATPPVAAAGNPPTPPASVASPREAGAGTTPAAPATRTDAPPATAPAAPAAPAAGASGLAPASFDDLVLMEPADIGHEEVEVRVTLHGERLVVFNLDAGRVVHQIYYRGRGPAGAEHLIGLPRLLTGSERWFILPTSSGDVVLRLDLDSSGDIITAYEARSGTKVPRVRGELAK